MTLKERCQAGQGKLEEISTALLDPRPAVLDHCEVELHEVMVLLDPRSVGSTRADRDDLLRLRRRIRMLALQTQQAVNLCQGWVQLGVSAGYTNQGKPALPLSEPRASYEV